MIKETIIKKHINFDTDLKNFSDNLMMFISVLSFTLFDREGLIKYLAMMTWR